MNKTKSLRSYLSYSRITLYLILVFLGWTYLYMVVKHDLHVEVYYGNIVPVQLFLIIGFFLFFSTIYSTIQWYKNKTAIFPKAAIAITCLDQLLIVLFISLGLFIPGGEAGFYGPGFFISMILIPVMILFFFTAPLALFLWLKYLILWNSPRTRELT